MLYELIDDPLCDVEGFGSYENCEDCPYFNDCMEVKDAEGNRYDVAELLEMGYHFVNDEPVFDPTLAPIMKITAEILNMEFHFVNGEPVFEPAFVPAMKIITEILKSPYEGAQEIKTKNPN